MQASDLPKQLLEARVGNPRAKGITVTWGNLLDELCLPSIEDGSKSCSCRWHGCPGGDSPVWGGSSYR